MRLLPNKSTVNQIIKSTYWFSVGFILSGALLAGAILFYFQYTYKDRVIPGVFFDNTYVGEMTRDEIIATFTEKNNSINNSSLIFTLNDKEASISAKDLNIGYDINWIADQALGVGKSKNLPSDVYLIISSYINGIFLRSTYTYDQKLLAEELSEIQESVYKEPVNAQFSVEDGKVTAFQESINGEEVDFNKLSSEVSKLVPSLINGEKAVHTIQIPLKITEPQTTTEEANDLGIVEEIGRGTSTFFTSIPSRVHNIGVASSKVNGILVAPGEEFSFNKALGDVSRFTGYQQAYIISGGRTVLGDGGGVCQVSTTFFRALLNAGLPITERHAHAYRVGYYEQDSPPGLDATIYVPTVDLKFKNDTENHILIQNFFDEPNRRLTFVLYGKKDGRVVEMTNPVVSNISAAPEPLYQDDPELPVGTVKQVDWAAQGAKSVFTRKVTKNGKVIIEDTFVSNYRPWQAVFLRGTKT